MLTVFKPSVSLAARSSRSYWIYRAQDAVFSQANDRADGEQQMGGSHVASGKRSLTV